MCDTSIDLLVFVFIQIILYNIVSRESRRDHTEEAVKVPDSGLGLLLLNCVLRKPFGREREYSPLENNKIDKKKCFFLLKSRQSRSTPGCVHYCITTSLTLDIVVLFFAYNRIHFCVIVYSMKLTIVRVMCRTFDRGEGEREGYKHRKCILINTKHENNSC